MAHTLLALILAILALLGVRVDEAVEDVPRDAVQVAACAGARDEDR